MQVTVQDLSKLEDIAQSNVHVLLVRESVRIPELREGATRKNTGDSSSAPLGPKLGAKL